MPSKKELALNAGKVLVKCLNPIHNTIKFVNHPGPSNEGLIGYKLDRHVYQIVDELNIVFEKGQINNSSSPNQMVNKVCLKDVQISNAPFYHKTIILS